jgi:membrane protein YqaA with SNARE-associated domain
MSAEPSYNVSTSMTSEDEATDDDGLLADEAPLGERGGTHTREERRERRRRRAMRAATALVGLGVLLAIATWASEAEMAHDIFRSIGVPGLFGLSVLSGFGPVPIITFFPALLEAGFTPVVALVTISLGMTTADCVGALIGRLGRAVVSPRGSAFSAWVERNHQEHPFVLWGGLMFYAAFVPLPNKLLVIPMVWLGISPVRILPAVFIGNFIFNAIAANGLLYVTGP